MTERGFVLSNKDKFAKIRIERNSACASCGKCGMTEKQKHMDFYVENTCGAVVGDWVELDIPDVNTVPLAFIAYIVPLVPAIVLMLVAIFLNWPIWASLVSFFGGLAVGAAIIAVVDKLHKHRWAQSPTMKSIIKVNGDVVEGQQLETTVENESTSGADDNKNN